jgi:CRP/FNR family cyclic AMP-dependent transcriptional regulator
MTFFDYPTSDDDGHQQPDTSLLADASDRDWADLLRSTVPRHLAVGETLFSPGATERSLYLVVEGALEVLVLAPRGRWRRAATVGVGNVIGEQSFMDGGPRTTLARALGPASVAELSHQAFTDLAATRPDLALLLAMDLGRIVAQRLRSLEQSAAGGTHR